MNNLKMVRCINMKHIHLTILLSLILFLIPQSTLASGVIVDAQGDVAVSRPGNPLQPARFGAILPTGSKIKVGKQSSATILLEEGIAYELPPDCTYIIGAKLARANRVDLGRKTSLAMREIRFKGDRLPAHTIERRTPRPIKMDTPRSKRMGIYAKYPNGTKIILKTAIHFEWTATPPVDWPSPAIVIDDAEKKHIAVTPITPNSTGIEIDAKSAKLKNGSKYSWYLATRKPALKGKTVRFNFETLSEIDEKKIAKNISRIDGLAIGHDGRELLKAQVYFGSDLYNDMVATLMPIWEKTKSPFVKNLLFLGFSKMGNSEMAFEYR